MLIEAPQSGVLIYDAHFQMTRITDFGVELGVVLRGDPLPPQGVRLDVAFAGQVEGPRLRGRCEGVDHLYARADGRIGIEVRGVITTEDGARIGLSASGFAILPANTQTADVQRIGIRQQLTLFSGAPEYAWVNSLVLTGDGDADVTSGEVRVSALCA